MSYSYAHVFKNIVQGEVAFSLPFGPKSKIKKTPNRLCLDSQLLYQRMVQPVVKHEIIPVHTKRGKKQEAVNPLTGLPVPSSSSTIRAHSEGTFKSPYSTLHDAKAPPEQTILFIFSRRFYKPGNVGRGCFKRRATILGATIAHDLSTTVGLISIPAQAEEPFMPVLTNTAGAVVTASSSNTISGFTIQNLSGSGILANGVTNLTATQNSIKEISLLMGLN